MCDNILFDVYGTLVDIYTTENERNTWRKTAEVLNKYGASYDADQLHELFDYYCAKQIESGKLVFDYPEIDIVEIFALILANQNVDVDRQLATEVAMNFRAISTKYLRTFDGVHQTLSELKRHGKKLYVLSNAQPCFTQNELAQLDLTKYFDGIVYSGTYMVAKPSAKLFDIAFEQFDINKSNSVYVGNDAFCDVDGAINAGIDCVWIQSSHTDKRVTPRHAPTYTIQDGDFTKLLEIL